MRGRFPNPQNPFYRGQGVTELVVGHARGLHDWLAARQVQMMIWGDMLLAQGEAPDAAHAPTPQKRGARAPLCRARSSSPIGITAAALSIPA